METLLPRSIPDLIAKYTIVKPTFLRQECSTNSRFLVRLEIVVDLSGRTIRANNIDFKLIQSVTRRKTCQRQPRLGYHVRTRTMKQNEGTRDVPSRTSFTCTDLS